MTFLLSSRQACINLKIFSTVTTAIFYCFLKIFRVSRFGSIKLFYVVKKEKRFENLINIEIRAQGFTKTSDKENKPFYFVVTESLWFKSYFWRQFITKCRKSNSKLVKFFLNSKRVDSQLFQLNKDLAFIISFFCRLATHKTNENKLTQDGQLLISNFFWQVYKILNHRLLKTHYNEIFFHFLYKFIEDNETHRINIKRKKNFIYKQTVG